MDPLAPVVFAIACGAFIVGAAMLWIARRTTGRAGRDDWRRLAVEVPIVGWILLPAALSDMAWQFAMALTAAVATLEWTSFLGTRPPWRRALVVVSAVGSIAMFVLVPAWPAWAAALCFLVGLAIVQVRPLRSAAGALMTVAAFASLARIGDFGNRFGDVVFLYGTLEIGDSAAYIVGSKWGRRPLSPRLSPNKTWAGLVGGIGASTVAASLLSFTQPAMSMGLCAVVGAVVGVLGVAADLLTSSFKRRLNKKDFADWLPQHGSLIDAYDSFLVVVPFAYAGGLLR